ARAAPDRTVACHKAAAIARRTRAVIKSPSFRAQRGICSWRACRSLAALGMTCVLMSCAGKDSRATVDSSLARDLAQANQGTPDLVPKDTALKRPETRRIEDRGSRIEEKTTSARIDTPRSSIPDPRSSAAALEEPTITPKFRGILAGAS